MTATLRERERLPWGDALTALACTIHAAVILIYASVFFGLTNAELQWDGVEQMPRWYLAAFTVGVVAVHGTVAFGPVLPPRLGKSVALRGTRAIVAVTCVLSVLFVALLLPFAAVDGAEWESWALMVALGMSAAVVLVSLLRRDR